MKACIDWQTSGCSNSLDCSSGPKAQFQHVKAKFQPDSTGLTSSLTEKCLCGLASTNLSSEQKRSCLAAVAGFSRAASCLESCGLHQAAEILPAARSLLCSRPCTRMIGACKGTIGFQTAHFGSRGVVRGDTGPRAGSFDLPNPSCRPVSAAGLGSDSSPVWLTRLKDGMPLTVPALLIGSS